MKITVTVTNEGDAPESFTVTLYCDSNIIGAQNVENLLQSQYRTLLFHWDTKDAVPCHNYLMTAVASTVPHETHTADNTLISAIRVKAKLVGDLNGDGKVDIKDLALGAKAFGSYLGDPRWNPDVDFNDDDKIDIRDLALIAINFGKICPYSSINVFQTKKPSLPSFLKRMLCIHE